MEESLISYSNGKHEEEEEEEEESGWTTYFDDFFSTQTRPNNDHHQQQQQQGYGGTNSSSSSCVVSDAASYVEYWKSSNALFGPSPKFSKKLKFKKTRTKQIFSYDDSLEDTASSPVNSPKIGSLKETEFNQRKAADDCVQSPTVQVGDFDNQFQVQRDDKMEFEGEINNNEETTLRKKGMCLVPVSIFANYLG